MLYHLLKSTEDPVQNIKLLKIMVFCGLIFSYLITRIATHFLKDRLPRDGGRDFAVDGKKSAGKGRGAGIIFVMAFICSTLLFMPVNVELAIYMGVLFLAMLSGFLDDAAATPWGEYKKGIIDFVIALVCAITYVHYNGSSFTIALTGKTITLNPWVFVILAVILIWASVNVVNCSDGVDGLSATLMIASLVSFYIVIDKLQADVLTVADLSSVIKGIKGEDVSFLSTFVENGEGIPVISSAFICKGLIITFVFGLLAYLLFNANPSILMMGDAGSRAMGMFLAIIALKSRMPLLFIPLAFVIILDGGLGLIKIVCIRFLKIKGFMKNVRTPLHDHVRKNLEPAWSPTQVVFRFAIIQVFLSALYIGLLIVKQ